LTINTFQIDKGQSLFRAGKLDYFQKLRWSQEALGNFLAASSSVMEMRGASSSREPLRDLGYYVSTRN